jgi:hypothetical protein
MAVALIDEDDEVNKGCDAISMPTIDLRDFDSDELLLIADFSEPFLEASFYDIVNPKIDRSCFIESAGSRRQTYSNRGSSKIKHANGRLRPLTSTITSTSSAVAAAASVGIYRKSVRLTSTSRVHGIGGVVSEPLTRSRMRFQGMQASSDESEAEEEGMEEVMARNNSTKRTRSGATPQNGLAGRKRIRRRFHDDVVDGGVRSESRQFEVNHRLEKAKQIMTDRLAKMEGKWSSNERTRKIVGASGFPLGWTVRVGLSYKNGRTMFEYRDWRRSVDALLS